MSNEKRFYVVTENKRYVDLPNGRFDVGNYWVDTMCFEGIKNMAKYFSHCCEESIEEYVFEDEKKANKKALNLTLQKLCQIDCDQEASADRNRCDNG